MAVKAGGRGDVTKTHVKWLQRRYLPTVPSPLAFQGVVYMVKSGGILTSLDAKSGELLHQGRLEGRGNYYASPVAGDGVLYSASEGGVVTVVKAGGELEVVSSHDFGERIMATPVAVDGQLFVRTDNAIYCFER
jgi:outer membrane protein assembly factor BamB